mmetsp:Transcript_7372/g.16092  ORF Transcript_7372/g.16092 Transcript_7372/m.16092 type:complete len:292 (-) Transcript_7372:112-987(-)
MSPNSGGKRGRDDDDASSSASSGGSSGVVSCQKRSKTKQQQSVPINQPLALEYVCPIFKQLPVDPVMAEDGRIYERRAIEEHIRRRGGRDHDTSNTTTGNTVTSPVLNIAMGTRLYDAIQVRNTIEHLVKTRTISDDMIYAWECNRDVWDAKRRAESGNVSAMRDLATWYYYGCRGLPKDNATSYAWCRRASDLGCTISMTTMCKCFLLNSDMADLYSPTLGVYYLTQAADNGYAGACVMLGTAFMKGQHGLPKDDALAERWLKSAMVKHDATNGLKIMARLLLEKLQVSS